MKALRRKSVFAVFFALTLIWMMVVFGFSSNNAEDSTAQSNGVTELFARMFIPGFDELPEEQRQEIILRYDGPVRKLAHFVSYAILGFLACGAAITCPFGNSRIYVMPIVSAAAVILFAVSDEYHQTFVDGRAGQLKDVFIDSAGGVFGTGLMIAVLMVVARQIDKNNAKKA